MEKQRKKKKSSHWSMWTIYDNMSLFFFFLSVDLFTHIIIFCAVQLHTRFSLFIAVYLEHNVSIFLCFADIVRCSSEK